MIIKTKNNKNKGNSKCIVSKFKNLTLKEHTAQIILNKPKKIIIKIVLAKIIAEIWKIIIIFPLVVGSKILYIVKIVALFLR